MLHQLGGVIFPIVFTCTVGMASGRSTERGLGKVERITTETPQVWLDCQVTELEGGLNISLEAVKELFPAETPAAMMEFYRKLLLVLSEDRQIGRERGCLSLRLWTEAAHLKAYLSARPFELQNELRSLTEHEP